MKLFKAFDTYTRLFFHRVVIPRVQHSRLVFSLYWFLNLWGNEESKSGEGSTLRYTERLRRELPRLLSELKVKTFLDAPCGDFHWMRYTRLPDGVEYLGGDIVRPMIKTLQRRYGKETRRFMVLDVTSDPLPRADLWMCRDLVFHLPNEDVIRVLENFLRSDITWLLITSHAAQDQVNQDIAPGQFRLINLMQPPFNLPEPRKRIPDYIDGYPERYLCLYHRDDLRERPWAS